MSPWLGNEGDYRLKNKVLYYVKYNNIIVSVYSNVGDWLETIVKPCIASKGMLRVIFHPTNERSHWTKDNISNPNLNSILLKNANLNNSILLKRVS